MKTSSLAPCSGLAVSAFPHPTRSRCECWGLVWGRGDSSMVRISAGALTPDTVPEAKEYLWKCFSNQGMQFSRVGAGLAPPCSFFFSVWQPGCQPPGADGAAWNSSGRLLSSYQSGLGWGRGCWGLRGLLWEKLECHTWGGAGGGGGCRAAGSAVTFLRSQRALLGALSLFRQEMSADSSLVGCHSWLAHRGWGWWWWGWWG